MSLIQEILSEQNVLTAMEAVMRNKGSAGVDKVSVYELPTCWLDHGQEVKKAILEMKYRPLPVRRVYIPKPNGKKRPLGIPTAMDRMIQQATAQVMGPIFDEGFSESSYGFRPGRSAHGAMMKALEYLNEGYEWIVDLDIEKFFDTVNHDKLISCVRRKVNDKTTLHLLRAFLRAGVMEEGKVMTSELGTPQGGCISPLLANIYLDELDKELESRGLRFVRYADDVVIFTRSEMAANRVMRSISSWLKRKLFLTVSPNKTHVCRPSKGQFLGFTFWKDRQSWKAKPTEDRKQRLYDKIKTILCRKRAAAKSLSEVFTEVNLTIKGWINYYQIGSMKSFLKEFGSWFRHKIRVVVVKQWKRPKTIYRNLMKLNEILGMKFEPEEIRQAANSRLGLYRTTGWRTYNFLLSPRILETKKGDRPGLVNPLNYYESQLRLNSRSPIYTM